VSTERQQEIKITDESGDVLTFTSVNDDEAGGDFTDDEFILVSAKIGSSTHVNINRADLSELRLFLEEVAEKDEEAVV
jgi:hypothetical protein